MVTVERFFQGDRNARLRLDASPWTLTKIWKKGATHASWLLISVATGGVLVFYFRDAPTLWTELWTGEASPIAYAFLAVFTATTYTLGGFAREQVCNYMCPWPRIQAAMFDAESLLVSYRDYRGEPRGPLRKGVIAAGHGDCIDCKQCVVACPMGIDIRDGQQLECITCALCIDACDDVMTKIGKPRGLIAYDTIGNLERRAQGKPAKLRLLRPRTLLYTAVLLLVGGIMAVSFGTRSELEINLIHDRNPLYVTLSDGSIRNGYTLKILNMANEPRHFSLAVEGLPQAVLTLGGKAESADVAVPPDQVLTLRLFVAVPPGALKGPASEIAFVLRDADGSWRHAAVFRGPE
jgi:cytochrome c oxidase accessory protein FixG